MEKSFKDFSEEILSLTRIDNFDASLAKALKSNFLNTRSLEGEINLALLELQKVSKLKTINVELPFDNFFVSDKYRDLANSLENSFIILNKNSSDLSITLNELSKKLYIEHNSNFNKINIAFNNLSDHLSQLARDEYIEEKDQITIDSKTDVNNVELENDFFVNNSNVERLINSLTFQLKLLYKKFGIKAPNILSTIVNLLTIVQMYQTMLIDNTQANIEKILNNQDILVEHLQKLEKNLIKDDQRVVIMKSYIKHKPNSKSLTTTSLSKGTFVLVLNTNHKWAYISYYDSKYDLPLTGWVLKKNLKKINLK